jgi:hypothetical protein
MAGTSPGHDSQVFRLDRNGAIAYLSNHARRDVAASSSMLPPTIIFIVSSVASSRTYMTKGD